MLDEMSAKVHQFDTGHRVAKWPVRSEAGQRAAEKRSRSGYYDKYNVGDKAPEVRLAKALRRYADNLEDPEGWDEHKDYAGV